jgi:hypothetical protein
MKPVCLLTLAILFSSSVQSQQMEKVRPGRSIAGALFSKPILVIHELFWTARDFASFRDPEWSGLTLAQIGAASADGVTSLNNLHDCASCYESGPSRLFIGRHPDAHKYVIGGAIEIGVEAVAAHYFRNRGPIRKWYWRALWEVPQTVSLFEHANAAYRNAAMNLGCSATGQVCR